MKTIESLKKELKKARQKATKNQAEIKALKAEIETARAVYHSAIAGKRFTEWKEYAYLKNWSDKEAALEQLKKITVILASNCRYFVEEIVKAALAEQLQKYAGKPAGKKTKQAILNGIINNFAEDRVYCWFEELIGEPEVTTLCISYGDKRSYLWARKVNGAQPWFIDGNHRFADSSAAQGAIFCGPHTFIKNPRAHVAKMDKLAQKYEQAKKVSNRVADSYNALAVFGQKRL